MSLEVNYKSLNGQMTAKFSGSDVKEVFEQIAKFSEVMETANVCKACSKDNIRLSVRVVEDNKYYEKICQDCFCTFSYGQHKKGGTLFPKWDRGWAKYSAPKEDESVDDAFDTKKIPAKKIK